MAFTSLTWSSKDVELLLTNNENEIESFTDNNNNLLNEEKYHEDVESNINRNHTSGRGLISSRKRKYFIWCFRGRLSYGRRKENFLSDIIPEDNFFQ